jgi:hypothetical protein
MIDRNIKPTKISPTNFSVNSTTNTSLSDLTKELQILKSQVGTVTGFDIKGDVIFTTQSDETYTLTPTINLNIGDKIRVIKNDLGEFEIINIYEKSKLQKSIQQQIIGTYTKNNKDIITTLNDKTLKVGQKLTGTYSSPDLDEFSIAPENKDKNIFNSSKKYTLEIKSIGVLSGEIDDSFMVESGLLGTLNEILSDDIGIDGIFAANVSELNDQELVVKTMYGILTLEGDYNVEVGTNLVLKIIHSEPIDQSFNNSGVDLHKLIVLANYIQTSLGNIIEKLGGQYTTRILSILSKILSELKYERLTPEKLSELIVTDGNFTDHKTIIESFSDILPQFKTLFQEIISRYDQTTWFVSYLPVYYDNKPKKQPIYINRTKKDTIRIVTDLELSEIGAVQIDLLVYLSNEDVKLTKLHALDLLVKYKKDLKPLFFENIKIDFEKISKSLGIDSKISFKKTNLFEEIDKNSTNNIEFEIGDILII